MIHGKTGYCIKSLYDRPEIVFKYIKYWKFEISPFLRIIKKNTIRVHKDEIDDTALVYSSN